MRRLVCLDNNILVWGVREAASPGQERRIMEAREFLERLKKENARLMVPTVVLGEFLAAVAEEKHEALLEVMRRRFELVPYDARAALRAARLWREHQRGQPSLHARLHEEFPEITRAKIKADGQIVATALTHGAAVIYSHDEPLRRQAAKHIPVYRMFEDTGDWQPELLPPNPPPAGGMSS